MKIIERGTIYQNTENQSRTRCAYFPSLARLSDGRILCTFQVATEKSGADETLRLCESKDEGQTWRLLAFDPNPVFNGVLGGFRIAHIVETKPNELFMATNWMDRSDPSLPISHPETAGCLEMKLLCFRSTDGGASWSDAEDLSEYSPFDQPEVSGPIIALKEPGNLLIPMENQKQYYDPEPINEKAFCLISRDYGKSWNDWAMICDRFPDYKQWCNRIAVLPESGNLVCFSWTFDEKTQEDLPIHIIHGSPDGTKWSAPVSTGVEGQLSTPFPLDESTLLMGYVHRHQPASIRLRKSADGGKNWDADDELIIHEGEKNAASDGRGGSIEDYYKFLASYTFGWNPMLQLKDGRVLMAYFAGTGEAMNIHRITIES